MEALVIVMTFLLVTVSTVLYFGNKDYKDLKSKNRKLINENAELKNSLDYARRKPLRYTPGNN